MEIPKIDYTPEKLKRGDIVSEAKQLIKSSSNHISNIDYLVNKYEVEKTIIESYYHEAIGFMKNRITTFWQVNLDSKMKVKSVELVRTKFRDWLTSNGIYRLPLNLKDDTYVMITDNIVEEINTKKIKKITIDYVNTLPDTFDLITRETLEEFIIKGANVYFSKDFLDFLPELTEGNIINGKKFIWNRDSHEHSFFYFKNKIVVVDKDGLKEFSFDKLYNFVWKSQLINRDYANTTDDCDFKDFISKICNEDLERINYVRSIIGYLIHSYKNKSKLWSVVLNDEEISDDPEGGNGKGLFFQAIGQLVEVLIIDGKNFSFDKNFVFQRMKHSTQIIFFDDVGKKFEFERLFSVISEGISIEKKGKDEFYIPFEYSPKIGIATNYDIDGCGSSVERRKLNIEFSSYFSKIKTPLEQYNKIMFDEWSDEEWKAFYNYMINCQIYYFKNGINKPETTNNEKRQFYNMTPKGFPDYAEDIEKNIQVNKNEFTDIFSKSQSFKFGVATVMRYVKHYCKYKGYEYLEGHSGSTYWFMVKTNKSIQLEITDSNDCPY